MARAIGKEIYLTMTNRSLAYIVKYLDDISAAALTGEHTLIAGGASSGAKAA